jgi:hypothetical protein
MSKIMRDARELKLHQPGATLLWEKIILQLCRGASRSPTDADHNANYIADIADRLLERYFNP